MKKILSDYGNEFKDPYRKFELLIELGKAHKMEFNVYIKRIWNPTYYKFMQYCIANNEPELFKKAKKIRIYHLQNKRK